MSINTPTFGNAAPKTQIMLVIGKVFSAAKAEL